MRKLNRKRAKKIIAYFAIFLSLVFFFNLLLFLCVYFGVFGALPEKDELLSIKKEQASLVYSSDKRIIGKYFAQNRTNIKAGQIPDYVVDALVATEDKRFFDHRGIDIRSYFRVFFRTILMGDKGGGGGSTLSQQLAKNLYGRPRHGVLSMPVNKIREIIIASRLEDIYKKEELILLYLNSVPFGEEVYGIESAAQRYFNKSANKLTIEESAVLIGILKGNTLFNPRLNPENSLDRRNLILKLMADQNYLLQKQTDSLQKLPLKLKYENLNLTAPAGYFVFQVRKKAVELLDEIKLSTGKVYDIEKDGLKIYTTLNMQLQELGAGEIKKHMVRMQDLLDKELENSRFKKKWYEEQKLIAKDYSRDTLKRRVELFGWKGFQTENINKFDSLWHYYKMLNTALLIINPKDGSVLSWIGGNHYRMLPFDMVLSRRQAASGFKPFLYAAAIENGFDPCTYLANEEVKYPGYEDWEPRNADRSSTTDSTVAMWYAMVHSLNLPSIDLYFKLGYEQLLQTCNKLNFPTIEEDVPSLAIGTIDLSLYELVRAYGALANLGQMNELVMIDKITDSEGKLLYIREYEKATDVFQPETSQIITAILQEAVIQGTGNKMKTTYGVRSEIAGKTGTAQNYSDAWFFAYTPEIVIGTWVGASSPKVHFKTGRGAGSSLALPVTAGIIKGMEKDAALQKQYLYSFNLPAEVYSFLACEPYRQKGVKGFFNRLFSKDKDRLPEEADSVSSESKTREEGFFRKLFKKKNSDEN